MLKQLKAAIGRSNEQARHRREYLAILDLEDFLLRDIGLEREDLRRLAGRRP